MNDATKQAGWAAGDSAELYNVARWGEGYFEVAADGHLCVRPYRTRSPAAIDLYELARRLPREGLELPVLVRFIDILHDRVDALTGAFAEVIADYEYRGRYTAVYPIKVNQQRAVVEAIVRHGGARVGLEAGSKPELAAVLGLALPGSIVVCNGYKDRAYIRRALIGQKLGHRVYIVVEKPGELALLLEEARNLEVTPLIGMRVRLASIGAGKWQNTGGEKSKFGLSCAQVLEAVALLRQAGALDALRMVHFHLGSQVANVQDIHRGIKEAARFYAELRRLGAPVDTVDVGGGLGVDYEGTRSRSYCSTNYSQRDYARNIVRTLQEVCAETGQSEPDLVSESGRALTAHHAVLVTQVIGHETAPLVEPNPPLADDPSVMHKFHDLMGEVGARGALECLHDAASLLAEAQAQFNHGALSLPQRAYAERTYFALCRAVLPRLDPAIRAHRETLDELNEKLAEKYFCNFSVFQSIPDAWAIDQVFPILPVHRLDERPALRATLCDLTCDSDGRVDQYVDRGGPEPTMPAHALRAGEPYLLGFFMVGAYQEILGDMHNLFGDTNAVNVVVVPQSESASEGGAAGGWKLEGAEHGDRTDELLRYVHLAPEDLAQAYRRKFAAADLPPAQRNALLAELEAGLTGYTYLS
ncbi:MAG: biosynthetic arginine decarboxylase [Nevskia sp.]|nr:biosynthetic arginine decarboxylase [Nevskia sp.]